MKAFFLFKFSKSFKYELILIFSILILLLVLPVATVIALIDGNAVSNTAGIYQGPPDPQDTYAYGNCTYWAFLRRQQIGEVIPTTWGNANTWATRAQADGYVVDHTPSYGAIMQTTFGALGHVAFVESVDPSTGSWTISEMNVVGWDVLDNKTMTASQASLYSFIHQPANQPSISLP
jgi:surface antigen